MQSVSAVTAVLCRLNNNKQKMLPKKIATQFMQFSQNWKGLIAFSTFYVPGTGTLKIISFEDYFKNKQKKIQRSIYYRELHFSKEPVKIMPRNSTCPQARATIQLPQHSG